MTSSIHTEGSSVLLRFSFVAERGRRALKHFLDMNGDLSDEDLVAIGKAREFLDFTFLAQQLATGQELQGFSPEKIRVRDAAYAVASATKPTKQEAFVFTKYLEHIQGVLNQLQDQRCASKQDVEDVKTFLTRVRDQLQGRSSLPIEVVNRPQEVAIQS